jgi:hypothetical protein
LHVAGRIRAAAGEWLDVVDHVAAAPLKNRRWLTLVGKRKPAPYALDN